MRHEGARTPSCTLQKTKFSKSPPHLTIHTSRFTPSPFSIPSSMSDYSKAIIDQILLPTDFSPEGEVAFMHALKIALAAQTQLTLLHIVSGHSANWDEFPSVREPLVRWGLIPPDAPRSAVVDLGIEVRKVVAESDNPVDGVLEYMESHPPDLVVLKTAVNQGKMQWFKHSEAKPLTLKSPQMTLIIPSGVEGFVSRDTGDIQLNNILIPVAENPDAISAVEGARRMVIRTGAPEGTIHLLHVGENQDLAPRLEIEDVPGWTWNRMMAQGPVVETIADVARDIQADAIIMSTNGRDGFLDALRGSHSERLLHHTPCPVIAIPESANVNFDLR